MKKIFLMTISLLLCLTAIAQNNNKKVMAVSVVNETNSKLDRFIVEDIFHEVLKSEYNVRIDQGEGVFSEALFKELSFQEQGGVISESITRFAQKGAELLCVIVVNKVVNKEEEYYYLRARIYDTSTATIIESASYPNLSKEQQPIKDLKVAATKLASRLLSNKDLNTLADGVWSARKKTTNGKALAYSLIPGVGLMMKGHKVEGTVYMVGDIALLGGGLAFMAQANKQKDIMNSHSTGIDQYKSAEKKYNSSKTAAYCCFGVAAALYVVNLVRGYVAEPKPKARLQWAVVPSVAPNMYGEPNMSVNLALSYKF